MKSVLVIQYNSSGANSASNSDLDENVKALKTQTPIAEFLFDKFVASLNKESPKEPLLQVLSEMHKNNVLLDLFEIVQDFEGDGW